MSIRMKHILTIAAVLLVMFALMPGLAGSKAFAEVAFESYPEGGLTFETDGDDWSRSMWITDDSEQISSAQGYDTSILQVEVKPDHLHITVFGDGKTTIAVIGAQGGLFAMDVNVEAGFMEQSMKGMMDLYRNWYGTKKIEVSGRKGTYGTLTVGKDKYTIKTIGEAGYRTVKLKKRYKLGTKISLTMKYGAYSAKKTGKIFSATGFNEVDGKKKTVKVRTYNLHKGDVVKISYKGKTYKKTIKKDYDNKEKTIKFKVKHKVKKTAKFTVTIKNKAKKVLYKDTIKLKNYHFEYVDEIDKDEEP